MPGLFEKHRAMLDKAIAAAATRTYWSAYPEAPSGKIYGETAKADAEAAFTAMRGKPFDLGQKASQKANRMVGQEKSPWGFDLGITYAAPGVDELIARATAAGKRWTAASIDERAGVCLEILHRINRQSFLIGNAVMHTTGQGFAMAFQAGGPHAQDRGLEAVAYAVIEMRRVPAAARCRGRGGLRDVSDVEWLSRAVRQPGDRQCRNREAASDGDRADGDHAAHRA